MRLRGIFEKIIRVKEDTNEKTFLRLGIALSLCIVGGETRI
jgi:hypothetical protein